MRNRHERWVEAGVYPPELLALCRGCGVEPERLLGWSVRREEVSIVLATGQKVTADVLGAWQTAKPGRAAKTSRG